MNLPSRARNGLNGVSRELLRQPAVEKPRHQWVDDVVAWCHQHDIDLASRINSKALRFDANLLAQINDDGRIYLTQTTHHGQFVIRVQVGQFDCTRDDVMTVLQVLRELTNTD